MRSTMDESHSSSDPDQCAPKKSSAAATASASSLKADVLEEIFLNVPVCQVICVCQLVCHQWKEVTDSESLWRKMCRREGHPICSFSKKQDWKLFYFLSKQKRNLFKNPNGEEGLNGWKILRNGGDQWVAGGIRRPHPDEAVKTNFATSFEMCTKSQLIELEKEGYSPSLMDYAQPDIKISDWFLACSDCGSRYDIWVELLNEKKELVQIFSPETVYCREGCEEWNQITHVFHKYGPGVRYIRFTHGGKDFKWWKGHYGIHITGSSVEVLPTWRHRLLGCPMSGGKF
uniref:FBA domain-containing protein n=1 Tax=Oreochromis aureus TaxID=47969 RepID=A0A668RQ26_OREAU